MRLGIGVHRLLLIFTLLALPFVVGSSCAFFFSSGGGSGGKVIVKDDEDDDDEEITPSVAQAGIFRNPATAGINYASSSLSGVTDSDGTFRYIAGETVQFFIGDIELGAPVKGKPVISPKDLVATDGAAAARNISRLLSALDANRADEVVTISTAVRRAAVRSNASVSDAIEFLDFSDEAAFANAASQLVSVLTDDYPHTATLTDADSAEDGEPASPTSDQAP